MTEPKKQWELRDTIKQSEREIYPEFYKAKGKYKIDFSSNSTFVVYTHLMRALVGPTILAMPSAFKQGGYVTAPPGFLLLLLLVVYNMRALILNAAYLSKRENITVRTYDEVGYVAFNTCSNWTKKYARCFQQMINIVFFVAYLDNCCIFIIFVAKNVESLMDQYYPNFPLHVRFFVFFQVLLIMSLTCIRELQHISPFSFLAGSLLIVVCITLVSCFFVKDPHDLKDLDMVFSLPSASHFCCNVLFCLSGISITLTLKSSMKNQEQFFRFAHFPGIFYISLSVTAVLFTVFGSLGYLKYGKETYGSILLNVPSGTALAVFVKVSAIIALICTCPLAFFVSFNVIWNAFLKAGLGTAGQTIFGEYFVRFCLIIICFATASVFPELTKMIMLKGAIFHSNLEITIPAIIHYVTHYPEKRTGKYHCRLIWFVFLTTLGLFFFVSGVTMSILNWRKLQ